MQGVRRLLGAGIDSARLDAELLLGCALGMSREELIVAARRKLSVVESDRYEDLLRRRLNREPLAYITGRREFYGLELHVTPAVLIPRPETELLVDLALARIPAAAERHVLDLGTGSGCIALSIAHARFRSRITAIDSAPGALAVARENAQALGIENVAFAEGNWFAPVAGQRFELIVSNPPYVAAHDPHLLQGDLRYEPRAALIGGVDGLDALRVIVAGAPAHLRPSGALLLEHGYDQGAACRILLEGAGFHAVRTWQDLAGRERVSGGVA